MTSDKSILASTHGKGIGVDTATAPTGDAVPGSALHGSALHGSALHDSALLVQGGSQSSGQEAPSDARHLLEDSPLAGLPMQLDVTVPVPQFRVHNLLALEKGAVLESRWIHTEDVPVWCGGEQLVWAEFEVVDQKLAVRVTRVG